MNSSQCVQALQKLLTAAWQRDPSPTVQERPCVFALLATLVLALATVAAIHLQDVAKVISVVGGSLTTLQMFWIPALIYWRLLYASQPAVFREMLIIILCVGGVAGFSSV